MEAKITVFGAGLVGSTIAIDLKNSFKHITVIDENKARLAELEEKHSIRTVCASIFEADKISQEISNSDIIVGALPGSLGYSLLERAIELKKNIVDISFCPEDYFELDKKAKKNGVTAIVDMGVAPGMCNAILGYHSQQMKVRSYKCIVGGLPVERVWPFEYKATWSPRDVIEEYVRPARFIVNNQLVEKEALSDIEQVNFPGIGTLEEWNSDGLRSLIKTMPHIPDMVEKTLRYPGTMQYIKMLRESGFFSETEVEINGQSIKPIDLTSQLLFPQWELQKNEEEFTAMQVFIEGLKNGEDTSVCYTLLDKTDMNTGTTSMARTTGYTCTGAVNLLLNGLYTQKGIIAPEMVGADPKCFEYILNHLQLRNINYQVKVT